MTLELLQLGVAAYCMASGIPKDKIGEIYMLVMHQPLPKNMAETILRLDAAIEKVMGATFSVDDNGKEVLVRSANLDSRYFYNFSLENLLVGFESCPVVTITVNRKPGRDFAVVVIEGEPHNEE